MQKMREAVALGANQMFLQGGVNPGIPFDYYLDVVRTVKEVFGSQLHIRAFSPSEIIGHGAPDRHAAPRGCAGTQKCGRGFGARRGRGDSQRPDARILSPRKLSVSDWVRVMQTCHEEGLPGSANIVFGSQETAEEIIEHLRIVRDLQDRTGGFLAFIPWTFQKQTDRFYVRSVPAIEYLKVLAVCRLFLDNIPHIEASIMVLGRDTGSLALHAGADDISSVVIEENVLTSHGPGTEEKAREFIRESGFNPRKRDLLYNLSRIRTMTRVNQALQRGGSPGRSAAEQLWVRAVLGVQLHRLRHPSSRALQSTPSAPPRRYLHECRGLASCTRRERFCFAGRSFIMEYHRWYS